MAEYPNAEEQGALTSAAVMKAGFTVGEVWLHYFSLSGEADEYEVEAYLSGLMPLPALERDILALAVNELIDELPPRRRAPLCDDLTRTRHADGPPDV